MISLSFCMADSSDIESFVYSSLLGVRGQYFVVVTLKECRLQWDPSKAWKDQLLQDQSVQNLAESLREMVCAANECPDLSVIQGTEDVIEAIGRVSLEIASFIDEYARKPFAGEFCRTAFSESLELLSSSSSYPKFGLCEMHCSVT